MRPMWRTLISMTEIESRRFFEKAAERAQHPNTRQLLDDLASEERRHENRAEELDVERLGSNT